MRLYRSKRSRPKDGGKAFQRRLFKLFGLVPMGLRRQNNLRLGPRQLLAKAQRRVARGRLYKKARLQNIELFVKMQRALFASRRKTVKNNLTKFLSGYNCSADAVLEKAGIDANVRAEALPIQELLRLSDAINFFIIKSCQ